MRSNLHVSLSGPILPLWPTAAGVCVHILGKSTHPFPRCWKHSPWCRVWKSLYMVQKLTYIVRSTSFLNRFGGSFYAVYMLMAFVLFHWLLNIYADFPFLLHHSYICVAGCYIYCTCKFCLIILLYKSINLNIWYHQTFRYLFTVEFYFECTYSHRFTNNSHFILDVDLQSLQLFPRYI